MSNGFQEFLRSIPGTFWGVVFGSFLSMGGVILSNRASDHRQKSQFTHDRNSKKEEREVALRKDIYLSVIEATQTGIVLLSRLMNMETTLDELTKAYLEKVPTLAKIHIVGSQETIEAMLDIFGSLSSSLLKLTGRRMPLEITRQQMLALKAQVSEFEKERDRWLEQIKQYNIAGKSDARLWENLQGNFQFEHERALAGQQNISQMSSDLFSRQMDFAKECLFEAQQVSRMIAPAVIAVRKELEVSLDKKQYEAMMAKAFTRQEVAISEFLDTVRLTVTGSTKPPPCSPT